MQKRNLTKADVEARHFKTCFMINQKRSMDELNYLDISVIISVTSVIISVIYPRGEDKYQVGNLARDNHPSMRVDGPL